LKALGFFWKVFGGTVAVILITAVVVYLAALPTIERSLEAGAESLVEYQALWAVEVCERSFDTEEERFDTAELAEIGESELKSRFTLTTVDGVVLFDSQHDAAEMDDHGNRPEILQPGTAVTRYSDTLGFELTYYALPVVVDGVTRGYARVSMPVDDRRAARSGLRGAIRDGAILAALISLVLAGVFARRITHPLSQIAEVVTEIGTRQTPRRLDMGRDDEFGRLARAVNSMADDLQGQIARVERDRAEREAIFTALADGLLAVDLDQNVLFINRQGRQLLGNIEGPVKGRPVWELTRNQGLIEVIEECLRAEARCTAEVRTSSGEGERTLEVTAVPMAATAEKRRGCVLELRDVSDLRHLEAVRRDFVSNVSHELKTPLAAMRGYTEALSEDPEMPEATRRSFVEKAHRNTERLAAIVGDLLSLSRLESQERDLSFEPLDLRGLLEGVIAELQDLADSRQARLVVEAPDGGLVAEADPQALSMAISNLISNAIQYSPEGEEVHIRLVGGADEALLEVIDRGPGIPPHEQERVFERFYRVDKARSRKLGGTGLGLAIVRHVMAAHGGRVELESQPGEGSLFRLVLPVA